MIIRKQKGFTLVELLVTMVIFVFVIAAVSQVFVGLISQFKQQGAIAATDTGGIAGLEIMRRDIAQAGYGLPWNINGAQYRETTAENGSTPWTERDYNDGPDNNPTRGVCGGAACSNQSSTCDPGGCYNPPAPFRSGDNVGVSASSGTSSETYSMADLLVIKSATVAMNDASQKWTYIANNGPLPNALKIWNPNSSTPQPAPVNYNDDLRDDDQIIVLSPLNGGNQNILQNNAGIFYTTLGDASFSFSPAFAGGTTPPSPLEPPPYSHKQNVVYGIAPADDHGSNIRMPFNRADYYVKRPALNMPSRCAPYTGILYKAVTNNTMYNDGTCPGGGGCLTAYPLLDCVADMQVYYLMDNTTQAGAPGSDGQVDWCPNASSCSATAGYSACSTTTTSSPTASPTGDISCLTAAQIRQQVKEVRVYIVAQEGQRDANYDFSQGNTRTSLNATIINPTNSSQSMTVATVNLQNLLCPTHSASCMQEYKYYRWKLYTLVVQPNSMN